MRSTPCLYAFGLLMLVPGLANAQSLSTVNSSVREEISDMMPAFGGDGPMIVEFFDYQCSYCKSDEAQIARLMQSNPDIGIIYMEFPKLGAMSVEASKAAVACLMQNPAKYGAFRHILMDKNVRVSDDLIIQAATYLKLDVNRLSRDMQSPAVEQFVEKSVMLGRQAGVSVTPSFIVGSHFFPGYHTAEEFQQALNYDR